MECHINRLRQIASIRIDDTAWAKAEEPEFEELLIHEMLHPVFDSLREEFDFLVKELPTKQQAQYKVRHDRAVEKVVEQLALSLYSLSSNGY